MRLNLLFSSIGQRLARNLALMLLAGMSSMAGAAEFSCEFSISSQWQTGASASLKITNNGSAAAEWQEVSLNFSDSSVQIQSSWNAARTGTGPASFQPYNWNRLLGASATLEVGMQLAKSPSGSFAGAVLGGDCAQGNGAPTAAFSISSFEALVTLDGSTSTDPDGDPLSYAWTVDGVAYDEGEVLSSRYFGKGTYEISLTVSDGELSDTETKTFEQQYPPSSIPVALFVYEVDELLVEFNGTTSRANGTSSNYISSYHWDFGDGTTSTGAITSHHYVSPGAYDVTLTVYDAQLTSDTMTQTVTVTGLENTPPVAVLNLDPVGDATATLDGDESYDHDGDVLSYQWEVNGQVLGNTWSRVLFYHLGYGTHSIRLTVSDGEFSDTVSKTITFASPNAPVAQFASEITETTVMFDGSASYSPDSALHIASYHWDFGDGSSADGATATHTYAAPGTYGVTLTVHDNAGASTSSTVNVTVEGSSVANDVDCSYTVTSTWGSSFAATIRLVNNGDSVVSGWSVNWDYGDGSQISSWWDANITGAGPYAATGKNWNADIAPGGSVQFGIQGTNGGPTATTPALGGATCG